MILTPDFYRGKEGSSCDHLTIRNKGGGNINDGAFFSRNKDKIGAIIRDVLQLLQVRRASSATARASFIICYSLFF